MDERLGVAVADRFTFKVLEFMRGVGPHSGASVASLMRSFDANFLGSTPEMREDLVSRSASDIRLIDFFSNAQAVEIDVSPLALVATSSSPRLPALQTLRTAGAAPAEPLSFDGFELRTDAEHGGVASSVLVALVAGLYMGWVFLRAWRKM